MQDLQTDETCELNVRFLSNVTPSVVKVSDGEMKVPAMLIDVAGVKDLDRWTVLSQIASDLSGFRDRPLRQWGRP